MEMQHFTAIFFSFINFLSSQTHQIFSRKKISQRVVFDPYCYWVTTKNNGISLFYKNVLKGLCTHCKIFVHFYSLNSDFVALLWVERDERKVKLQL